MAEFVEVMKNRERLCHYYDFNCTECPLSHINNALNVNCDGFINKHPTEAEKNNYGLGERASSNDQC